MSDSPDSKPGRSSGYRGALQSYLRSIRRYPLLTQSGEYRLASQSQKGMASAQKALVEANLRLVVKIAKEYRNRGIPMEDLISEGNIGLIEASRRFDPARGVRFVSYASWWIRKYMVAALTRQIQLNSTPAQRDPAGGRAGDASSPSRARWPYPRRQRILSLEEFIRSAEDRDPLESLASSADIRADELILEQELVEGLRSILHRLPSQERHVLVNHFGLEGKPPRTLQEIGVKLGCTRERVRQIELRALERARRLLAAKRIRRG
jgi:RNA polymerase sigma factor (sigma-70 family)